MTETMSFMVSLVRIESFDKGITNKIRNELRIENCLINRNVKVNTLFSIDVHKILQAKRSL